MIFISRPLCPRYASKRNFCGSHRWSWTLCRGEKYLFYPCRKSIREYWMVRLLGSLLCRIRCSSSPVHLYLELIITGIMLVWRGKCNVYTVKNNPKELQDGTDSKNIAATLETRNCKHTRLAKEWGCCILLPIFWIWLPCETCVSHRVISSFWPHTLVINEEKCSSTICWGALLYLQRLRAKDTGRQEAEWLNDDINIPAIWMNEWIK